MNEQTPHLSEHQNHRDTGGEPAGYQPTPEQKKAILLAQRMYEKAKRHRSKYDDKWLDRYKFFRGKQWNEQRPSYRHAEVINFVFQAIQSTVPVMTDSRPKFEFLPQEPSDMELSEVLSEVSASDWERGNWLQKLTENVYDSHFYGHGVGGMGYDAKALYGMGQIDFTSEDPFHHYPDPNAYDFNDSRMRYHVKAEPVDIDVLKREYPDVKDFIKADLQDLNHGDKTEFGDVKYRSPTDNLVPMEGESPNDVGQRDKALKITLWIFPDEFTEEKKESPGPDGQPQVEFVQKLEWPMGRKICVAGGVLLDDGPFEFEDGKIPFARLVNYILPREFFGMSEVEQLESPQKIFNKLISYALDVMVLMGNPIWKVGTGSGVDTDNLFNRPGLIVEADDISQVQREEGVQLQPYVMQLIDRMQEWFQELSGRTDVTSGVQPGGVTAASAISSLQEAAQTRTRLKARNLDAYLQHLGQLYKNRVFEKYTSPRVFRLTNNQNAQKFFKFYVEPVMGPDGQPAMRPDGTPQRQAVVRDYVETPAGLQESLEVRKFIINGDFDVRVSTGSSLPFAKTERINVAKMMLDAGAIDEPELLKAADYPNWEAVWERVSQAKAAAAQAEMDAQMAAKGGPPAQAQPAPPPAA